MQMMESGEQMLPSAPDLRLRIETVFSSCNPFAIHFRETTMKKTACLFLLAFAAGSALAIDDCESRAAEKKLAGAAKTSFLKKCQTDFRATPEFAACEQKAGEKKLAGAARNSFMKKCVHDTQAGSK